MDDLIAMNALYRPGPMQFIPQYIECKHGRREVEYPHEDLRVILEPTYGIMVYQEQIMQVARAMGGYSLGEADILRRAMGKKKVEEMGGSKKLSSWIGRSTRRDTIKKLPGMSSKKWHFLPVMGSISRTRPPTL